MHLCSKFAASGSGLAILNVNYRHTPEYSFPTQPNDVWAAFELFASRDSALATQYGIDPERVVIGGTSAGASLSLATAMKNMMSLRRARPVSKRMENNRRDNDGFDPAPPIFPRTCDIKGLVLLSPPTVHPDLFPFDLIANKDLSSPVQFEQTLILSTPRVHYYYDMYISPDDEASKRSELVSPLLYPDELWDRELWPPTSLHISGLDSLRDEGILMAEKLKRVGIKTQLRVYMGYPHAFNLWPGLAEAKKLEQNVMDDLKFFLNLT